MLYGFYKCNVVIKTQDFKQTNFNIVHNRDTYVWIGYI